MPSTLAPASWKSLLKEHPGTAEAAVLTKALEDYNRAEGKGDAEVEALERVVARAEAVKKKNAKLKPVVSFLADLIVDAEKQRARVAREIEAGPEADGDDDEGEEGAALKASLVRVKKLARDDARPFVLALGAVAGLVIAKRPPISRDHRNQARAMRTGKGKILLGLCYGEGGKYVFELETKPPGGLTKVIKKAAKVHAKMDLRLKVRGGGEELDDETDTAELTDFGAEAEESEATAPAADRSAAFVARARAAKADLDRLGERDQGRAAPLKTMLATALGHAQGGRAGQANEVLTALEGQIAAAPRQSGPSWADQVKALARRVRELLDKVQAADPGRAARLKTAFATALGHAQAGRTGQAINGLSGVEAVATRVLAATPSGGVGKADWTRRLNKLAPALKEAIQAGAPRAQEVKLKLSEAQVFARKSEFGRALGLLDDLAGLLGHGPGGGASGSALPAWTTARGSALGQIEALRKALRATGDPDLATIAGRGLDDLPNRLGGELATALSALAGAGPDALDRAAVGVRALLADCRRVLSTDPVVGLLEDNPFGVAVGLRATLAPALDAVERSLGA